MVKVKRKIGVNTKTGELQIIREGKENRDRIFEFIYTKRAEGVKAGAIIRAIKLSKETVHKDLRILLKDKRIYQEGTRYYPVISIRNEFLVFGKSLEEGAHYLIDRELMESIEENILYDLKNYPRLKLHQRIKIEFPEKIDTFRDLEKAPFIDSPWYLMRMLVGPITTEKYCTTSFGHQESLEKCIFEFSNRIGAYIAYIFLQSLYPLQVSKFNDKDRSDLCKVMIEKGISISDFFIFFRDLVTQLGFGNPNPGLHDHEKLFELSQNNFDTISKGLEKVYPNLYIGFENWWQHVTTNTLALRNALATSSTCLHEWKKITPFKYSPYYHCKKCNRFSGFLGESIKNDSKTN